jgi:hypothetical protein
MEHAFPVALEIVAVDLPFPGADGPDERLTGRARVRWVRHEETDELLPGVGLEFVTLDEPGRSRYLTLLEAHSPRAYIPLGRRAP